VKKYIFTGAAMLAVIMAVVLAVNRPNAQEVPPTFHGFYGTITYTNCDCIDEAYGDRIYIKKLPSGPTKDVGLSCHLGVGSYDTEASDMLVFEPGDYQLWVWFNPSGPSECETSQIVEVEHNYQKQQVNLIAYGPTGGGSK
jgi:hypothetical protein